MQACSAFVGEPINQSAPAFYWQTLADKAFRSVRAALKFESGCEIAGCSWQAEIPQVRCRMYVAP